MLSSFPVNTQGFYHADVDNGRDYFFIFPISLKIYLPLFLYRDLLPLEENPLQFLFHGCLPPF